MTHGSLYSGIGGWLLAARWAGIENIFTCEIDDFCNKVLKKHFTVEQYRDIKETDFTKWRGSIDILSTSDPCQPFSFAGKRGGTTDDRFLWPFTIEAIRTIKPAYVVFENVPGFISMAFETVASDLEAEGYTVESFIIPACAVGAWHRRDRLWIIAYYRGKDVSDTNNHKTTRQRKYSGEILRKPKPEGFSMGSEHMAYPNSQGLSTFGEQRRLREAEGETRSGTKRGSLLGKERNTEGRSLESRLGRGFNGLSPWLDYFGAEPDIPRVAKGKKDRVNRLKAMGNSIVPQIAYLIFEAIKQVDE